MECTLLPLEVYADEFVRRTTSQNPLVSCGFRHSHSQMMMSLLLILSQLPTVLHVHRILDDVFIAPPAVGASCCPWPPQ